MNKTWNNKAWFMVLPVLVLVIRGLRTLETLNSVLLKEESVRESVAPSETPLETPLTT